MIHKIRGCEYDIELSLFPVERSNALRYPRNDQISRHTLFLQQGRPAIAVSSQWFIDNMETQELTHTPKDNLSVVSYDMVAECATGIAELVIKISLISFYAL